MQDEKPFTFEPFTQCNFTFIDDKGRISVFDPNGRFLPDHSAELNAEVDRVQKEKRNRSDANENR